MIIKYVLASRPHNPYYLTKYINFIKACQAKNIECQAYTEQHHICPKADDMFPEFASFSEFPWNCAKLTPRQHYIAHLMLYKIYNNYATQIAYEFMNSSAYKTRTKSDVTVRDKFGNTFNVDKNDPRYLAGDLVHICKGKVAVRDPDGNTFQVDKTDSRYISGYLVSVHKGKPNTRDRRLSIEQAREIRLAMSSPTSILTDEYLATVVSKYYIDKIGKVPIEELKYCSGRRLSCKSLIAKHYVHKFKVSVTTVLSIIDGKSYKDVVL